MKTMLWDLAFRPWFLLASMSSMASISVWLLYLNGHSDYIAHLTLSPAVWHAHEMIFGFAALVAVAFLLTAAQTWTGKRSLNGKPLIILSILWIIIRILLWSQNNHLTLWIITTQTLWWLCCIAALGRVLISANNRRNYIFLPLLSTMMLLNIGILYADIHGDTALALHLARVVILLFGLLVGIIGGRVIPFFTAKGLANSTGGNTPIPTPWLDRLIPAVSIIGIIVFMSSHFIALPIIPSLLMISAGLLHLCRLRYWNSFATIFSIMPVPLLWSLHISYSLLGIGLIALGTSYFTHAIPFNDAIHIITIGTIGAMILAMMSRVSLGHTGRPLILSRNISYAFSVIFIATLARFTLPLFNLPVLGWNISGIFWLLGFSLFVYRYTPILTKDN